MSHLYDVIFAGESLASRIAAALLTRQGKRVLVFGGDARATPHWLFGSFLLDEVLARLGWRAGADAFAEVQVITPQSRVDLHGPGSLDEEIAREIPYGQGLIPFLGKLSRLDRHLEETFKRRPKLALAGDIEKRLVFLGSGLRGKFGEFKASGSFRGHLRPLSEDERTFAVALFEGLACAPLDHISLGEAALLWGQAMHPQRFAPADLEDFLVLRFEQFHGNRMQLDDLHSISRQGRLFDALTKNGVHCRSRFVVFGDQTVQNRFFEGEDVCPAFERLSIEIAGQISPLLAQRILLAGDPALRLLVGREENGKTLCTIDLPGNRAQDHWGKARLCNRLSELFPFTSITWVGAIPEPGAAKSRPPAFPSLRPSLRRNPHGVLLCQGAALWPRTAGTGEVLAGLATADHLFKRLRKR